jgi:hypothetical protein
MHTVGGLKKKDAEEGGIYSNWSEILAHNF